MPHVDEMWREAQRPDIPQPERYDINAELFNEYVDGLRFPDQEEVVVGLPALMKASPLAPFYEQHVVGRRKDSHTAILYLNEYGMIDQGQGHSRYLEKRSIGGFQFLKDFVHSVDLIQAIIRTRIRQVMGFLVPERDEGPLGFRVCRRDGEEMTDDEQQEARVIEEFLLNSGDEADPCKRDRLRRSDLEGFVTKLLWDTLSADACPVELVRTNGGKLLGYHNLDFSTIRLCTESGYEGEDEIRAVQLIDYMPAVTFTYDDLLYEIRTPRTDLYSGGYGCAEAEGIVRAMTGYLESCTYNAAGISRSSVPRGILTLFGNYDQPQLNSFTRTMKAMLSGGANRHNIPILVSKDAKEAGHNWTPIDQFDEMYFARWLTFQVSITCAQYGIDPNEVHFDSFSTRSSALGGKADTEEKLAHSHDKGLVPTVRFVEKVCDRLVRLRNPKYRYQCVGLHQEDPEAKRERLKLSSTWNELRAIDGREPTDDPLMGDAPAGNPGMMQVYLQSPAARQHLPQQPEQQPSDGGEKNGGASGPGENGGEDYQQDARGRHAPYGQDPDGGDANPPPKDAHFHTLTTKATPLVRPRQDFLVIVEP